jgi:protein TonB
MRAVELQGGPVKTEQAHLIGEPTGYPNFPVQDLAAGRTSPWAIGTATAMNAGLLALMLLFGLRSPIPHFPPAIPTTDIHLKDFTLIAPASLSVSHGGGGGGDHSLTDPTAGHLPPREENPIVPPQQPVLQHPIIAIDSAINVPADIKLPDDPSLQHIGVPTSPIVTLVADGQGRHGGIGSGSNGGDGPGDGPGYGTGRNGGYGGDVYSPGSGGVSNPIATYTPVAEFSDEARRHKYEGVCIISIIVDAHGNPINPRVTRSLGMGLDEKALEAVQKYHFKPAMKNGKPVASYVSVEINFHLF